MAAKIPTYNLAPNWDIPPTGVPLGSIIADPKDPQSLIDRSSIAAIPTHHITTTYKSDWSCSQTDLLNGNVGIFASFLASVLGIGADATGKVGRSKHATYRAGNLETTYFAPDNAYLATALQSNVVNAYVQRSWRTRSVYMVVGLKIAHKASIETARGKERGAEFKLTLDGTTGGVPVNGGPEFEWNQSKKTTTKFGGGDDFLFGYRLLKLTPKKNGGFEQIGFNRWAVMDSGKARLELSKLWDIESMERESSYLGLQPLVVRDDDGHRCVVLTSRRR